MAGQLGSFLTGASVIIRIGDRRIAYAQNLNIASRMDNQAVYGLGSASPQALEPVMHSCSWSMSITRYITPTIAGQGTDIPVRKDFQLPDNVRQASLENGLDGNSMLDQAAFNPQLLLLSSTFDIAVYNKNYDFTITGQSATQDASEGALVMVLKDCRMANYTFAFAPGELLIENVSGIARLLTDSLEVGA